MMNSSSRLITPDGGPITRWVVSIGVAEADVKGEAEVTIGNAIGLTIERGTFTKAIAVVAGETGQVAIIGEAESQGW